MDAFLAQHLRLARWFNHVPEQFVLQRDPKDSKYLNLAITAVAPFIVTLDLDLLDLMKHENAEGRAFRSRYPDIQILTPTQFEAVMGKDPA